MVKYKKDLIYYKCKSNDAIIGIRLTSRNRLDEVQIGLKGYNTIFIVSGDDLKKALLKSEHKIVRREVH